MPRTRYPILLVVALVPLFLMACGGGDDDGSGGTSGVETNDGGDAAAAEISVEAVDFAFEPNEINVEPGADVTLEFSNGGEAPHTFTAADVGVDVRVDPGGSETITFTAPDESATVDWMCTIHPQMTGSLEVGEGGSASGASGSDDPKAGDADSFDY